MTMSSQPRPTAAPGGTTATGAAATAQTTAALRAALAQELPGVQADLARLVAIPSVSFPGFDHAQVDRSAALTAELLAGCGLAVSTVRAGGQPAVIGTSPAPPGAPTVLLYAHHDVQPPGEPDRWDSDPFTATERDGRLFGRGAADDKAGVMAHVAALRTLRRAGIDLPVGVVVFVEGEEEHGSESLERLLAAHRDTLAADVIVIADSANWQVGVPALTTSLRGLVNLFVAVRTLGSAVHSGMYGGPVPDALTVLCRLLASLHDDAGDVAVEGLFRGPAAALDYPPQRLRADAGLVDGVALTGTGTLVERLWTKPALSVLGIDAPDAGSAPNALVASARAKLSLRIAPGDDPKLAYEAVERHLHRHAPWGVPVQVTADGLGAPCALPATGPAYQVARSVFQVAWDGVAPVDTGVGGSIPFIATFQELFPAAEILVTGVVDPDSRAHGPNESLHLGEFARACLAETLLLTSLPSRAELGKASAS